jgi:hypothetical protein
MKKIVFAAVFASMAPALAFAQVEKNPVPATQEKQPKVVYEANTQLDFEVHVIRGEVKRPMGAMIGVRTQKPFDSMIDERSNFKVDLAASLDKLKP